MQSQLLLSCLLVSAIAACGDDGGSNPCTPGESVACTCTSGASGAQVCEANGTFGACECAELDAGVDAPIDAPMACNPSAAPGQQGCATGEKCTWIVTQDSPEVIGQLGCVPDGTVAVDGTCEKGAPGLTTGFDNCTAGNICIGDKCRETCSISSSNTCDPSHRCVRYAGLYGNGDDPKPYGACAFACDPITQQLLGGGSCPNNDGCYLTSDQTTMTTNAICAGAGSKVHGESISLPIYPNSCAPGFTPRKVYGPAVAYECAALCLPTEVTTTTNMTAESGMSPHTCVAKGAAAPSDATNGESCRYWHWREPFTLNSPYSNSVGYCFKHAAAQYDSNGDMIDDAAHPRCTTLTHGDVLYPTGDDDAVAFACAPRPGAFVGKPQQRAADVSDELTGWR